MTAPSILQTLERVRLVAVVRASSADLAVRAGAALAAGGISAIELTYSTPDNTKAIERLRSVVADHVIVGAGTVTTVAQASDAISAGAAFVVSPDFDRAVIERSHELGTPTLPGAFTPTEIKAASTLCSAVKLFPAALYGPSGLRGLLGPFPSLSLIPSGGVTRENMADWIAAGAPAVCASSQLAPAAAVSSGDIDTLSQRAAEYRSELDRILSKEETQ